VKRGLALGVLLVSAVAFGAGAAGKKKAPAPKPPPPPPTEPSAKLVDAMGEKPAAMLAAATKVTLYKVLFQVGVRPNPQLEVGVDFERQGAGRELTPGELKQLHGIVYDEKSFKYAPPPCSQFVPEVAMLAQSDTDTGTLEMLYSFKCNALMFFTAKTAGRSIPGAQIDFKPSRKALLELVKGLMPQDAAVRALK
jgi:hypothetical protein